MRSYKNYLVLDKGGDACEVFLGRGGARLGGADAPKWVLQFKSHVLVVLYMYMYIQVYMYNTLLHMHIITPFLANFHQ